MMNVFEVIDILHDHGHFVTYDNKTNTIRAKVFSSCRGGGQFYGWESVPYDNEESLKEWLGY